MNKKNLMYGDSTTPGWANCNMFNKKNVNTIEDPSNPKKSKRKQPKVSVPSPFARFELVQKAYSNVALKGDEADIRDRMLVWHSLDVMELFYEDSEPFEIKQWSKKDIIKQLKGSPVSGHVLLGEAMELYMRQENYGFDENRYVPYCGSQASDAVIYILTYDNDPIGCTSPTSFFMATPNFPKLQEKLKIEGDTRIFSTQRNLWQRDNAFVEYVYEQASYLQTMPEDSSLAAFKEYLTKQLDVLAREKPVLYQKLNKKTFTEEDMQKSYQRSETVELMGFPLYQRRRANLQNQIQEESDFVISSTKSTKRPLVLSNNGNYNGWAYLSKNKLWDQKTHKIDYSETLSVREGIRNPLPGTKESYEEGWLCESDFLSNVIIQLPYPLDNRHFFDGNVTVDGIKKAGMYSYYLPIKPKYFEFFDAKTLFDPNHNFDKFGGEDILKIEEENGGNRVVVSLLIPVKDGKVVRLKKVYNKKDSTLEALTTFDGSKDNSIGQVVECPVALNIFPFVKLSEHNHYDIQVMRSGTDWDAFKVELLAASGNGVLDWKTDYERSSVTHYYSLEDSFEYLRIKLTDGIRSHEAVLIPQWGSTYTGSLPYTFAFDFGTTNSHIAVLNQSGNGDQITDIKLGKSIVSTIDQLRKKEEKYRVDLTIVSFDLLSRKEFLPDSIGDMYSFPLRTVMLQNNALKVDVTTPGALRHVNIPFIYGKEDHGAENLAVPNIKWSIDDKGQKLSNAFIEELVLLARAYAIENNGDLQKCSFVWTYPLSMGKPEYNGLKEKWNKYYKDYFNPDLDDEQIKEKVRPLSESIAPLLYYQGAKKALEQRGLSIDIGGGTCDVVIKGDNDDIKFASFRFAADVIFGAGNAKENPMVQEHYGYFKNLLKENKSDDNLMRILKRACESDGPATEANSVLFALENNPFLSKVDPEDKSYNKRLNKDLNRKVIFMYFYASIVYYLTKLLQANGYEQPKQFMFSGTGSKLLNIIGGPETIQEYTSDLIEMFSDGQYKYDSKIRIVIEGKEPKQITAKGALHQPDSESDPAFKFKDVAVVNKNKLNFSMVNDEQGNPLVLKYADLKDSKVKEQIVSAVKKFNERFIECSTKLKFVDDYCCDKKSLDTFVGLLNNLDVLVMLNTQMLADRRRIEQEADSEFEGSLFFYPIMCAIQNEIIPQIK